MRRLSPEEWRTLLGRGTNGTKQAREVTEGLLVDLARDAVLSYWQSAGVEASPAQALEVATKVISSFTQVTPPEVARLPDSYLTGLTRHDYVTIRPGGRRGGRTIKPGNILLDLGKLVTFVASSGLTIVGAVTVPVPWALLLAAIVIWRNLWTNLKLELSEREAATIWTMWQNRDDDNCVSDAELLDMVNSELGKYGRGPISREELDDCLERLDRIRCIERSKSDPCKWWLKEKVRVEYTLGKDATSSAAG